jgi:hypothetical protein
MADKRAVTSAENGKKGGRPVGRLNDTTLAKRDAQEVARKRITERLVPILDAQIDSALGLKHFMLRDPKTGEWSMITRPADIIKAMNDPRAKAGSTYLIYAKDPNQSAIKDLLDRALDRPKESMDLTVQNADVLVQKLMQGRQRAAKAKK